MRDVSWMKEVTLKGLYEYGDDYIWKWQLSTKQKMKTVCVLSRVWDFKDENDGMGI